MGAKRVIWHVGFGRLLRRRGSPSFEVREEVPLSDEPPRMDYLLLRKVAAGATVAAGDVLRRLWALLPLVSVVEYKSPGRSYRTRDLDRLRAPEARWFLQELVGTKEAGMSVQDLEGYEELMAKLLDTLPPEQVLSHYAPEQRLAGLPAEQRLAGLPAEQRLAGLPAEQRLAGLPAEQRLAGLDRDHQALALPVEVLRLLPETYLRSLAPAVEAEIRRRLAREGE